MIFYNEHVLGNIISENKPTNYCQTHTGILLLLLKQRNIWFSIDNIQFVIYNCFKEKTQVDLWKTQKLLKGDDCLICNFDIPRGLLQETYVFTNDKFMTWSSYKIYISGNLQVNSVINLVSSRPSPLIHYTLGGYDYDLI